MFFRGLCFSAKLNILLAFLTAEPASVLIIPADNALILIPLSPRSTARYLTDDSRAALATPITL